MAICFIKNCHPNMIQEVEGNSQKFDNKIVKTMEVDERP